MYLYNIIQASCNKTEQAKNELMRAIKASGHNELSMCYSDLNQLETESNTLTAIENLNLPQKESLSKLKLEFFTLCSEVPL